MRLGKLLVYFDTSPALRLLRSPNAPFIIDVFDRCFKQAGRITLAQSELLAELIHYQEELHESHPEKLQGRADAYLSEWCSPDALWLRRSLQAGRDEPVY